MFNMPLVKPKFEMNVSFADKKAAHKWANKWNDNIHDGRKVLVVTKSKRKDFHFAPFKWTTTRSLKYPTKRERLSRFLKKEEHSFLSALKKHKKKRTRRGFTHKRLKRKR